MDSCLPALCRQIGEADIAAVVLLLARGFPDRTPQFWCDALQRLTRREPPPGLPRYGYLLEYAGVPVGVVLTIYSAIQENGQNTTRCNLSCWYVDPVYRAYASLLASRAHAFKNVTYLNISPAQHTRPMIEAQGFSGYCDGVFAALPMFRRSPGDRSVRVFDARQKPVAPFDPAARDILLHHAEHGCISLWCETPQRAYPFVFRPRVVKRVIPCVQMVYCGNVSEFVRFAGPLGRYLARRGRLLVIVDSNDAIPGLLGMFSPGKIARYFKGPQRPRLGDLAYTECALLGV